MSCDKNKSFQVANLFNELKTDGEKRIARLNLGVKDSDSLTWGNIGGNIYDLEDLIYFVEMLKMLASLTGTVVIFRLNDNTIDRTIQDIPQGWQDSLPDTTPQDELWMTQAVKQGGIYKVGEDGIVWGVPIKINYSNVVDAALQEEIDELTRRLNESILNLEYVDNIVNSMNLVTVNDDGSISVTGRDGQVSVWQHQDLGNYLLLGNIYGTTDSNETSYFVINKTGLLLAHNAVIHGTIYATDGWFAGELRAATGSFRGEITATSGRIGGWQIIDGVLKPENVPTTALIGKIQASQVDFGTTLVDLKTSILDDYNNKISTLRTSFLQSLDLVSTRFLLSEDSIQSSVLEIREVQNTLTLKIRTIQDNLNQEKNNRMALYLVLESKILLTSDQLSLGVQEAVLAYSNKFKDYVTTGQLESKLSLLSTLISAKVSKEEYNENNRLIESKFAEFTITPEEILSIVVGQMSGIASSWNQTTDALQAQITLKGELLSQLGITSDGIIMKGNTLAYYATDDINNSIFACNSDGSGRIAKGKIAWNSDGYGTLAGKISWDNTNLSFTNGRGYDMILDSTGLVVTLYEENTDLINTITLPGGQTIHVNRDYSMWAAVVDNKPYANLTDTKLTLDSGRILGNKSILSNSAITFTGPYAGVNTNLSVDGFEYNSSLADAVINNKLNEILSFNSTTQIRQLDINTGNTITLTKVTTITIGQQGIHRIIKTDDVITSDNTVTWDQFFNKFTN